MLKTFNKIHLTCLFYSKNIFFLRALTSIDNLGQNFKKIPTITDFLENGPLLPLGKRKVFQLIQHVKPKANSNTCLHFRKPLILL